MDKESFLDALKKIEWPTQSKVLENFGVVMFFLIALIIFFLIMDETLGKLVSQYILS